MDFDLLVIDGASFESVKNMHGQDARATVFGRERSWRGESTLRVDFLLGFTSLDPTYGTKVGLSVPPSRGFLKRYI